MNKSFILLDKNTNLQKSADVIVKFSYEEKDYLVYSVEENEQNSQIFVSKIILNSEGKNFIDNVMLEEKSKLNNIVYNLVILTPTEFQKGISFDVLINNLFEKFSVKLSSDIPELGMQEYFSNSSVAITSKVLVAAAVKFYCDNLVKKEEPVNVPTWTAPVEATAPTPMNVSNGVDIHPEPVLVSNNNVSIPEAVVSDLNLQSSSNSEENNSVIGSVLPNINKTVDTPNVNVSSRLVNPASSIVNSSNGVEPNPQAEKLAIVSDPSLGLGISQPNIGKTKKAGFANTKYIVVGSICLILAVAVVIAAYILIKNMQ